MKDAKKAEDEALVGFDGKISPALLDRKLRILTGRRDKLTHEIEEVQKQQARQKYGNMTLNEISAIWDGKRWDRWDMAYEIPAFREYLEEGGQNTDWAPDILSYEFAEVNEHEKTASSFFEEFCKGGKPDEI